MYKIFKDIIKNEYIILGNPFELDCVYFELITFSRGKVRFGIKFAKEMFHLVSDEKNFFFIDAFDFITDAVDAVREILMREGQQQIA